MKKTIIHVITSLKIGGAESLLVDFLSQPLSREFHHKVLFFHDGPNRIRLQERGIDCFHIRGFFSCYDFVFFFRLYRLIRALNPHLLHTWLWSANITGRMVGWLLRIPILNSVHSEADMNGFIRNTLDRYTQRLAHRTTAVSYGVAKTLHTICNIPSDSLIVIKNGVNSRYIRTKSKELAKTREELGLTKDHYVIGAVGRLVACKNYQLLLRVFARLYDRHDHVRLVLLGTGPEKQNLYELVRELALDSSFILVEGQLSYGYYPLFDCFVQTSFKEGISIALLEAMSCCLPVFVATECTTHEVLDHEVNGILVPSYKPEVLGAALEDILYDKPKAQRLGNNAYQTVERDFSLDSMIRDYYKEYRQLINL